MRVAFRVFDPLSTDHDPEEYWHHGGRFVTVKEYADVSELVQTAQGITIDGTTEAIRVGGKRSFVAARTQDVIYETLDDDETLFNCVEVYGD